MSILVAKPQPMGTKLNGNPMPAGLTPATITSIKDLGQVAVNPAFAKTPGETKHKVEFVFTDLNGNQARKDYTVSLHEKSALVPLIVAVTGAQPTDNFDLETLLNKNLTLITTVATSQKGTKYTKIAGVGPASPGQKTAVAPVQTAVPQTPQAVSVGW